MNAPYERPSKPKNLSGRWEESEDEVYKKFILENDADLQTEKDRRSKKIFEKLSALLGHKRTADQCRSHHTKMKKMSKEGSI